MSTVGRNAMKLSREMLRELRSSEPPPDTSSVPVKVELKSNGVTPENHDVSLKALMQTYASDDVLESDVEALLQSFDLLPRTAEGLVLLPPTLEGFRAFVQKQLAGGPSNPTRSAKEPAAPTAEAEKPTPPTSAEHAPPFTVELDLRPSAADIRHRAAYLGESSGGKPLGAEELVELLESDTADGPLTVQQKQQALKTYLRAVPRAQRQRAILDLFALVKDTRLLLATLTVETARLHHPGDTQFSPVVIGEALAAHPEIVFSMAPGDAARVARALELGADTRNVEVALRAARATLGQIADHAVTTKGGSAFALELLGAGAEAGLDEAVLFAAARHLSDGQTLVLREAFASPAGRAAFAASGVPAVQKLELLARLVELEPGARTEILHSSTPVWANPTVLRLLAEPVFSANAETQAVKVRPMFGSDLESSVGTALGLAPEPLKDPEEQRELASDVAAGIRSPYQGEHKETVDRLAAKIREVGGDAPSVAVVSVALMSEHSGVRTIPLFKVKTAEGDFDFVDRQGRRYGSLAAFERENPLPPGIMVSSDDPLRSVTTTPSGQPLGQALATLDLVAMGVGTVAGVATMIVPNPVTGGVAVAAGIYTAARSGSRLADRATHGQSLVDREAAVEWLTVIGGVAGGASPLLRVLGPRSRMATAALRGAVAADVVAFAADGALTVEAAEQLYSRWDELNAYDRMSLSMQIGFFAVGAAQAGQRLYRTQQVKRALRDAAEGQTPARQDVFSGADGLQAAHDGTEFAPGELVKMQNAAEAWVLRHADAHPEVFTPGVVDEVRAQIQNASSPRDFAQLRATVDGVEIRFDADGPNRIEEGVPLGERFLVDDSTPAWRGRVRRQIFAAEIESLHVAEGRIDDVLLRFPAADYESVVRALTTGVRNGVPLKERLHYVREELAFLEGPLPKEVRDKLAQLESALSELEALSPPAKPTAGADHKEKAAAREAYRRELKVFKKTATEKARSVYDSIAEVESQLYTLRRIESGVRTKRSNSFPWRIHTVVELKRRLVAGSEAAGKIDSTYRAKVDSLKKRGIQLPESLAESHGELLEAAAALSEVPIPRRTNPVAGLASRAEVDQAVARFNEAVEQLAKNLRQIGEVSTTVERLDAGPKGAEFGKRVAEELSAVSSALGSTAQSRLSQLNHQLAVHKRLVDTGAAAPEIAAAKEQVRHSTKALLGELRKSNPPKVAGELRSAARNILLIQETSKSGSRANLAIGQVRLGSHRSLFQNHVFVSGERGGVPTHSPHSLDGHGRRLHGAKLHPGPRDLDSEVQILERVREVLLSRGGPEPNGSLVIYSDKVPCPSCQRLLAEFKEQFPGIEVEVHYMTGEELIATPESVDHR